MASRAVTRWRATRDALGCRFGKTVAGARRCEADGAKFNVVKLEGGGFVVTSADTSVRPIVFFSDGEDVVEDPGNPLFALLTLDQKASAVAAAKQSAGVRMKFAAASAGDDNERQWAELLDERPVLKLSAAVTPSDIRVEPLVQSAWGQSTVGGKRVFNYCTPSNCVCGCVATAMAQIMRFHQYPTASMPQFSNPRCSLNGVHTNLTSMGGTYDWGKMPPTPNGKTVTEAEQQAIGKLCYDAGVSLSMGYTSGASASSTYFVPWTLKNRFGYSGAIAMQLLDESPYSPERRQRAMITNFDAGLPVQLGLGGTDGGHSIVGDGYGYVDGEFCCHLNFGWSGSSDGWYLPPPTIEGFNIISPVVYNIYTTRDPSQVIISGRVLTAAGSAATGLAVKAKRQGVEVASATTNAKGIFALFVQPGSYVVEATSSGGDATAVAVAEPTVPISNGVILVDGNPSSYKTDVSNSEICNAHVGDIRLSSTPSAAVIGNVGYATLAAALAAAAEGDTIHLLQDVAESPTVTKPLTIDFEGHTLTGTLGCTHATDAVTLANGTVTGDITSASQPIVFNGGTYLGTIHAGARNCAINGGNFASLAKDSTGVFEIYGGRFASDVSAVASFPNRVVLKNDGAADYPWVPTKVMRTMAVSSLEPGAVVLSFGEPDRHAYSLCLAYGAADGGDDKRAWTTFVPNVATIAADATTCTVALPAALCTPGTYYRFFLMETAATGLPYVQDLEYIQSAGSQYIDTGVIGKSDTQMAASAAYVGGSDKTLLGAMCDGKRFYPAHAYYSKWRTWAGDWNNDGTIDHVTNKRVSLASEISATRRALSVDGVESFSADGGTYDLGIPMYLFAGNVDGTAANHISARVYSMDLTQDGTLVRRFRPVKLANGDGALYDEVTETVFSNQTATAFVLGELPASADEANRAGIVRATTGTLAYSAFRADSVAITDFTRTSVTLALSCQGVRAVYLATGAADGGDDKFAWDAFVKLGDVAMGESSPTYDFPAGTVLGNHARIFVLRTDMPYDRELEYIQSGSGQYIDTGVKGRTDTKMDAVVAHVSGTGNTLVGSRSGNHRFFLAHVYHSKWRVWNGEWDEDGTIAHQSNKKIRMLSEISSGRRYLEIDGTESLDKGSAASDTGLDMYIFGANIDGDVKQQMDARVYSMDLTQDGKLVRRFHPVYCNGGGALYDEVTATVFTNQKAGTAFGCGEYACGSAEAAARKGIVKASSQSLALAETVGITKLTRTSVTLDVTGFGARSVYLATGATDGGDDKFAWDTFVKLGDVNTLQSSYTFPFPSGTTPGDCVRIFVLRTDVPYDRELEYIQSGSGQYIDTGVKGKTDTKMDAVVAHVSGTDNTLVGSRSGNHRFFLAHVYYYNWRVWNGDWDYDGTIAYQSNKKIRMLSEITSDRRYLEIDGMVSLDKGSSTKDTDLNMYLFGANIDGAFKQQIGARVYSMDLTQDGNLVRRFRPVYANGDGALYDEVTDAVFPNQASTPFALGEYGVGSAEATARKGMVRAETATLSTVDSMSVTELTETSATVGLTGIDKRVLYLASGPTDGGADKYAWESFDKIADIVGGPTNCTVAIPEGKRTGRYSRLFLLKTTDLPYDRELQYLQSSGTQYIDSGIVGKSGSKMDATFAWMSGGDSTILGTRKGDTRFYMSQIYGSWWCKGYGAWNYGPNVGFTSGKIMHVECELKKGLQELVVDGVQQYKDTSSNVYDTGLNMYVFGCNWDNQLKVTISARLYGMSIWQDDVLMRKYMPVVKDGKGALYDDVSGTVFTNQGTGDFTIGEAVDEENRRGIIKETSVTFAPGVLVEYDTANDRQTVTVPTGATLNSSNFGLVAGNLEKCGAGTLALAADARLDGDMEVVGGTVDFRACGTNPMNFTTLTVEPGAHLVGADNAVVSVSGTVGTRVFTELSTGTISVGDNGKVRLDTDLVGWDFTNVELGDGVTIDLFGHSFALALPPAEDFTVTTFTDSTADPENPGKLHVCIPGGQTFENTAIALTGNLRIVKEGEGTFVAKKKGQAYLGGTEVAGGTFRIGAGGVLGGSDNPITVGAGATFDVNGYYDLTGYDFVLAGGTFANTRAIDNVTGKAQIKGLTLTADSYLRIAQDYGLLNSGHNPTVLDLGGHTLTANIDNGRNFILDNATVTNGTLVVSGGYFRPYKSDKDVVFKDATLVSRSAFKVDSKTLQLDNYTSEYDGDYGWSSSKLTVKGVFKPVHDYFSGCKLLDGATLDLSTRTGTWTARSLITAGDSQDVRFEDGATITVDLTGRTPANGDKIVAWNTAPGNLATLTFSPSGVDGLLEKRDDGLYYKTPIGTIYYLTMAAAVTN